MNDRKLFLAVCACALLSIYGARAQQVEPSESRLPSVKGLTMMAASIPSSDIERSLDFYTKGLGLTAAGRVEMGTVIEVPLMLPGGGAWLLLQHPKSAQTPLPVRSGLNRIVLIVPDLKALQQRLESAGYAFKRPINEMPQYRVAVAHVEDPDGNHIELIQRT